jgi:hypothetical protein
MARAVASLEDNSMPISGIQTRESATKGVLVFVMHQLTAWVVVPIAAPFLFGFCFDLLRPFGYTLPLRDFHRILTELHYFPVQIVVGFLLGWSLGRYLRHEAMRWVWIIPLLILCVAAIAVPAVRSLTLESRLAYFFGQGCRPVDHCFAQLPFTLPFYAAASYSLGAAAAFKMFKRRTPGTPDLAPGTEAAGDRR